MLDSTEADNQDLEKVRSEFLTKLPSNIPVTIVRNKADLSGENEGIVEQNGYTVITLSAKRNKGLRYCVNISNNPWVIKPIWKEDSSLAVAILKH